MTIERKLLVAAGALIIALIIAVGFFSLGLYIGQHGILPDAPQVAGPGGAGRPVLPGQPPQPGGGPDQSGPGGWSQNPPGPGAQSPRDGAAPVNPAGRPSNLPPGPPDLVGPLQAVDSAGLTVGTRRGSRLVKIEAATQVFDTQGKLLSPEALAVDTHVAVFGHFTDDGRTMAAETVIILPPPAN